MCWRACRPGNNASCFSCARSYVVIGKISKLTNVRAVNYERKGKRHSSLSCSCVRAPSCVRGERKEKMKRCWAAARGVNGISIFYLLPEPA